MVAEVCHFFGWTDDHCLDMPAVRFFIMLNHARRMRAISMLEQCDIAAIAVCNDKYFEFIRRRYERALDILNDKDRPQIPQETKAPNKAIDSGSDEARYAMMEVFSRAKQTVH